MDDLAGYALLLRTLAHGALGWLPFEPRLHVKRVLAEHAFDDSDSAARLDELTEPARAPGPGLAVVLEALAAADSAAEWERLAHGAVKPALARSVRARLAGRDPRAPAVAPLIELGLRQERHSDELPVRHAPPPPYPLPTDVLVGGEWAPHVVPAAAAPQRDPFVALGAAPEDGHAALNAEVLAGEVAARTAHEQPRADPQLGSDLARVAADRLRRAALVDAELLRSGVHWGDRPVDVSPYAAALGGDLRARLVYATVPGDPAHEAILARWRAR